MILRYLLPLLLMFMLSPYASLAHATLDAIFANFDQPNRICLGDGMGGFTCSDVSADTNGSLGVALGDVNGDTFLDAVFANFDQPNRVCLGDGTGGFTCSDISADINYTSEVALGDVNGDTSLDAVFANSLDLNELNPGTNRVCLGDGTGGFICSDVSADTNGSFGVALGDVNGDTFLDAVFANSSDLNELNPGTNRVCLGDGTGGFTCSDVNADTNASIGVALGDVNGDTFLDAVFANFGPSFFPFIGERNRICLGDGMGGFTCSDVSVDTNPSEGIALGDVNGDTFLDAVFANFNQPNRICLGDGAGGFTCSDVSADINNSPGSPGVALGDVNGDTLLDAVFANIVFTNIDDPPNQVCLGDGAGGFTCSDVSADTNHSSGVALGAITTSASDLVDLAGTVETADGTGLCALVLASGDFMFSCNPNGPFSLTDLPRESDGMVKRQVYVDGFFPEVDVLQGSVDEIVVMTRASSCPDYNSFSDPSVFPDSAGKRIDISGMVLLQDRQTPICAIVLANGQFMFSCDGTGSYALNIPLDNNGQFKLQVYADGFAPTIQLFNEFSPNNDVRMARAVECQ